MMASNDLLQAYNMKISKRLILCYAGIILALVMSTLALYATFYHDQIDPVLESITEHSQHEDTFLVDKPVVTPEKINIDGVDAKVKTLQAINLLYAADFSYHLLHNKEQSLQIINLVKGLLPQDLNELLAQLEQDIDKAIIIDQAELAVMLENFKTFYLQEVQKGSFGQKTIAKVVRVEDQVFMRKEEKLLAQLAILATTAESVNEHNLQSKIIAVINAAQDIDPSLGNKSQEFMKFSVDYSVVSFSKVIQKLYKNLGSK